MMMATDRKEVHVLGPLDDAETIAGDVLGQAGRDAVVIDLSARQLITPHPLQQRLRAAHRIPDGVQWINAQERFADRCAEKSLDAYVEWLADAPGRPIAGGKSIKELFNYELFNHERRVSLWWFAPMATKHGYNHPYRWLFYMIAVVRTVRAQYEGATWHLWMPDDHTATALGKVLREEETVAHVVRGSSRNSSATWRTGPVVRSLHLVWRMVREALKLLAATWQLQHEAPPMEQTLEDRGRGRILFQTYFPHSWSEVPEHEHSDPGVRQRDRYFGDAPWRLKREGFDVRWMPGIQSKKHGKQWQQAKSRQTLPGVRAVARFGWRQAFRLIYSMVQWTACYLWYFDIKNVHQQWRYEGIPLGHWLANEMRQLAVGGWRQMLQMEQYRSIGEILEPDAVLYRNELYAEGRVVSAALKGRTKLVGVQHGLIGREHTVYQFDSSEIAPAGASPDYVHHCPVPDVFAAFGERFVELFEEWDGFPASRVKVVGGLRHDALVEHYANPSAKERNSLRRQRGLPIDRPVILLCTGMRSLVAAWMEMAIHAAKTVPEAFLAVKLHQYHGGETHVHAAAEERGFASYQVFFEGVYALMAASDVVIGGGSTVLIEAGLLGTPIVALTPSYAYQHYAFEDEAGFMQEVTNEEELGEAVQSAIGQGDHSPRDISTHMANTSKQASIAMEELVVS